VCISREPATFSAMITLVLILAALCALVVTDTAGDHTTE
jgi:hypothetical protein